MYACPIYYRGKNTIFCNLKKRKVLDRIILFTIFLQLLFIFPLSPDSKAATPQVYVAEIKGTVNPGMAGFISRAIGIAEENGVPLIIALDTPGGLDTAMRDIVQRIISARVPVIIYVYPPGARAASAGVFIAMAAHVAAMAPNTVMGAAHPVAIGPEGQPSQIPKAVEEKVLNDAVAYIRAAAIRNNRNADWAEKAVRESVSVHDREALDLKIIDVMARDIPSLLEQIDGRKVKMIDESTFTLSTFNATQNQIKMTGIERFLFFIGHPNIAYILLSLGMLGILIELSNPGIIFPGFIGGISLFLALYSLGMLEANIAALLLIALAFILFIVDALVTSHGMLTAGGIASMIVGGLLLFRSATFRIDLWLIILVAFFFAGLMALVLGAVLSTYKKKQPTGMEGMKGMEAVAVTALSPRGTVKVRGELWEAVLEEGSVNAGDMVIIKEVQGLKLKVVKKHTVR